MDYHECAIGSDCKDLKAVQNALAKFKADSVREMSRATLPLLALVFDMTPAERYTTRGLSRSLQHDFLNIELKMFGSFRCTAV